jgi:YrbI family 3-deoxy-D-manno-octulosonate 8-phosphate phosphatase
MDFDGVFTDNRVLVFEDGREAVFVSRADGMGISLLRKVDFPMVVISTERNPVVSVRCKKLHLECIQGIDNKLSVLRKWASNKGVDMDQVAYAGNDINDVECMKAVGNSVAVADAHPSALKVANMVLSARGGHDAIREIVDIIIADD